MTSRFILVGLLSLTLSGCVLYAPSAGNPNGNAYLGGDGSTYESTANPPRTVGQVSYNPSLPLPQATPLLGPSGAALPGPMPNSPR